MKKIKKTIMILVIVLMFFYNYTAEANSNINWEDWKKEDYWEWNTRETTNDKAYNGKHIIIEEDRINFFGYGQNSYKDFLYKEYKRQGKKIFKFRLDETKANYHTLDGAGFIFNASKVEDKLSGYVLLFKQKDVCIYRIDNIDINTFKTSSNSTVEKYGELVITKAKTTSTIHDLVVEATPTNIKITEGNTEIINLNLDYSKHCGESFGLLSSYTQHDCSILSKIQFSDFEIVLEDYKIEINNYIKDTDTPISGAKIALYQEGKQIATAITDNKGKVVFTEITEGEYTYKQLDVPDGYELNTNEYQCKVNNDGTVEFDKNDKNIIYNEEIIKEQENVISNDLIGNDIIIENYIVENEIVIDNEIIENNIVNDNIDNTRANKVIPYAGENSSLIGVFITISVIFGIGAFIKIRKYN